jgi:hypothetical protein
MYLKLFIDTPRRLNYIKKHSFAKKGPPIKFSERGAIAIQEQ